MAGHSKRRNFRLDRYSLTKMIIAFTLVITIVTGTVSVSRAEAPTDYSFYTLASVATAALSSCASDNNLMSTIFGQGLNVNSAGGVLGYQDSSKSTGIIGFLSSAISGSAVTYNYTQLCSGSYKTNAGVKNNVFSPYCAIGACLSDLGIDQTGTEVSGTLMRKVIGSVTLAAYYAAQCVTVLFKTVIKILKMINPFQFFSKANTYASTSVDHTSLEKAGFFSDKFESVTIFISRLYGQLYNLGTVFVTIAFAVMVISVIMACSLTGRTGGRMGSIKKFLIRASFVVFGIPLLGGTYTAVLDHLSNEMEGGNTAAAKVVASTFCDFEGWVMLGMRLPEDLKVTVKNGAITACEDTVDGVLGINVQDLCYGINQKVCTSLPLALDSARGNQGILKIIESAQTDGNPGTGTALNAHNWVIDILTRYMTGKKVYASSYEQKWIATFWTSAHKESLQMYIEKIDTTEEILGNDTICNLWYKPRYEVNGHKIRNPFARENDASIDTADLSSDGYFIVSKKMFLSPMSVYNYLNSTFDTTSIKVFSSEKSSSTLIRDYHYSVTLVGKGISSIMLFLLCITLLITYAILGFVYGFGIVMTNFGRGVRLIIAVPGAMLGSVQSVAKIVSYTVLMLLEVIINIALYAISTDLLYNLAYVLASNFDNYTSSVLGIAVYSSAIRPIISFVVVVFLVWFCIQCIKLRKPVTKALEEMADNVVRQFITGNRGGQSAGAAYSQGGTVQAAGASQAELEPKKNRRTFIGRGIEKAKDTSKQEAFIGQMFGGGDSAFAEEQAIIQNKKEKRAAKKWARREKIEAGKKALIGTAKVAVGAATGNAALALNGGGDLLKSADMANQAAENQHQANLKANTKLATTLNPNMAKHDERLGYTRGQARPVERVTMKTLAQDIVSGAVAYTAGHDLKNAMSEGKGLKGALSSGQEHYRSYRRKYLRHIQEITHVTENHVTQENNETDSGKTDKQDKI